LTESKMRTVSLPSSTGPFRIRTVAAVGEPFQPERIEFGSGGSENV